MTKISVIIPCHNGTNYLKDSYESVNNQGFDVEVIVIDDNSTDGTQDYAKKLGIQKVYETTTAKGLSAARNVGLKNMTGDYVMFLDHDDIVNEDTFKIMLDEFKSDSELQVVMAKLVDFISPELTEEEKKVLDPRKEPYGGLLTGAMLFKKEVIDVVGGFDESLVTGQGVDFMLRVDKHSIKKKQIEFISTMRRFHNNNMGRTMQQQEFTDYASILRAKLAAARKAK
jgi:glycosyltransferase involved in cell wall biosynthesis